jgi:hypothetical protein
MRPLSPLCFIFVLCSAVAASAGETLRVTPGKWQIHIETTNSMQPTPQIIDRTECVTESEWDTDDLIQQAQGCTVSDVRASGDRLQWKMACGAPGGQMTGEGDYRSSGDAVEGTVKMAIDAGGMSMTTDTRYTGKRVGACD